MDILTFLGARTVPDKEKPDGHFDISRSRDKSRQKKPDGHFDISRTRDSSWQRKAWWTFRCPWRTATAWTLSASHSSLNSAWNRSSPSSTSSKVQVCQFSYSHLGLLNTVFWILRIRIKFVGLQNPDPDPCLFIRRLPSTGKKGRLFFLQFFRLLKSLLNIKI